MVPDRLDHQVTHEYPEAVERDPGLPRLADRRPPSGELGDERLDLRLALGAQRPERPRTGDRGVHRIHVDAQRVREDREEEEQNGYSARDADEVRGDTQRFVSNLWQHDVRAPFVEDLLHREHVSYRPFHAPGLIASVAHKVGSIDVSERGHVVLARDPLDLARDGDVVTEIEHPVRQAPGGLTLPRQASRGVPRVSHVRDVVACLAERLTDAPVEVTLHVTESDEQQPERAVRKRSDAHDPPVHDVALLHVPICPTSPPLLPDPLALGLGL